MRIELGFGGQATESDLPLRTHPIAAPTLVDSENLIDFICLLPTQTFRMVVTLGLTAKHLILVLTHPYYSPISS